LTITASAWGRKTQGKSRKEEELEGLVIGKLGERGGLTREGKVSRTDTGMGKEGACDYRKNKRREKKY